MRRLLASLLALWPVAGSAEAACVPFDHEGRGYVLCEVSIADDLRLFHSGEGGLYGSFSALNADLATQGLTLGFAMNAGMYAPGYAPLGLYIEDGLEQKPLITSAGPGNFGMQPNGVFCATDKGFAVIESRAFAAAPPQCRIATQSGPMLVIDGALHPRFLPDSDSLYIRNGVGVSPDGQRAVFAISDSAVSFHQFARLFRDALGMRDALYLDGSISRLYAPKLRRHDRGLPFGPSLGPIIGTVVPRS